MERDAVAAPKPSLVERVLMRCPGQCAVCRAWSAQQVCIECLRRYARPAPRCWTCAARLPPALTGRREPRCASCLQAPPALDRSIAALDCAFPWDALLQRYRFHQALDLREVLLERLEQALLAADAPAPDWLLPVPLSRAQQHEGGYDQHHALARTLARRRKLAFDPDMLVRIGDTAQPVEPHASAPAAEVRPSFALDPARALALRGSHVALLDDVMTTGATLFALARVLRQAGVQHVQAWVVARTPET